MNKCILIYDDDVEVLLVCTIILEKQNCHVETRTHCKHIIKDVDQVKPIMILMDIRIPDIGGERATNLIKKNKDTQHIPVILFSAISEIEKISKRATADGFLKKPFEIGALVTIVENNI